MGRIARTAGDNIDRRRAVGAGHGDPERSGTSPRRSGSHHNCADHGAHWLCGRPLRPPTGAQGVVGHRHVRRCRPRGRIGDARSNVGGLERRRRPVAHRRCCVQNDIQPAPPHRVAKEIDMQNTRLGRTGLEVSRLALGTWAFGGDWGSFDEDEARATIHRALELGVTFFDTAQAYGFGVSERLLADGLWKVVARDQVVVATKGGLRLDGANLVRDASAKWLRAGVECSLRNLATDYIDLYQVHWPDLRTP